MGGFAFKHGRIRVAAWQVKLTRGYPDRDHPVPEDIEAAYLIRGSPPQSTNDLGKWVYYNENELQSCLGCSMSTLLPIKWPKVLDSAFFAS